MKSRLMILLLIASAAVSAQESGSMKETRMQWFADAKLGIFIHWGVYAVKGTSESWAFYDGAVPYDDYMAQRKGFTASKYDPDAWATLFKESGARYAVLTSKHHDGMALYDTKLSDLNVVKQTPAGRDLVTPYCQALRKQGLKVGLYFSHLDWSHPDYPHVTRVKNRYELEKDPPRWERFKKFQRGQIEEIATRFHPDLFWFDGDWDYSAEQWNAKETREMIFRLAPESIVNSRINGYGDYDTPEQGVPLFKPKARYWELCMTINDSWGYQGEHDTNWKTPNQVLRILVDCISMGGNLLLDVGPKEDGTIPPEQVNVLRELGRWTKKHEEAVYGTLAGIPKEYFYGSSALSKDSTVLYLYLDSRPNGPISIKGLNNKILKAWVVGNGGVLNTQVLMKLSWSPVPGIAYITLPPEQLDPQVTVVALKLDGPLSLFRPATK
jgi:alpha-L-fucosidase